MSGMMSGPSGMTPLLANAEIVVMEPAQTKDTINSTRTVFESTILTFFGSIFAKACLASSR